LSEVSPRPPSVDGVYGFPAKFPRGNYQNSVRPRRRRLDPNGTPPPLTFGLRNDTVVQDSEGEFLLVAAQLFSSRMRDRAMIESLGQPTRNPGWTVWCGDPVTKLGWFGIDTRSDELFFRNLILTR